MAFRPLLNQISHCCVFSLLLLCECRQRKTKLRPKENNYCKIWSALVPAAEVGANIRLKQICPKQRSTLSWSSAQLMVNIYVNCSGCGLVFASETIWDTFRHLDHEPKHYISIYRYILCMSSWFCVCYISKAKQDVNEQHCREIRLQQSRKVGE